MQQRRHGLAVATNATQTPQTQPPVLISEPVRSDPADAYDNIDVGDEANPEAALLEEDSTDPGSRRCSTVVLQHAADIRSRLNSEYA
jgi:hypothetical protein